jgi:hypothetical protein
MLNEDSWWNQRSTIVDLIVLALAIGAFALFGAVGREFAQWKPGGSTQRVGRLMIAVWAAWTIGFPVAEMYPKKVGLLIFAVAGAGWLGSEIIDVVAKSARRWVLRVLNLEFEKDEEDEL